MSLDDTDGRKNRTGVSKSAWLSFSLKQSNRLHVYHSAQYCPKTKGILLFGGTDANGQHHTEVMAISLNAKQVKKMKTSGRQPPPLSEHGCVMWGHKMIVMGGKTIKGRSSELYILNTGKNKILYHLIYVYRCNRDPKLESTED